MISRWDVVATSVKPTFSMNTTLEYLAFSLKVYL